MTDNFNLGKKSITPSAYERCVMANVNPQDIFTEHERRANANWSGEDQNNIAFFTLHKTSEGPLLAITAPDDGKLKTFLCAAKELGERGVEFEALANAQPGQIDTGANGMQPLK